ncbi:DUF3231 family protein [Thalassobacillus pellis]|uniref:DUF3231 family protein n=1 Tax=Thalassobacillus pellis TaxID=748008 RepID=UPI001960A31D|nr:DUF3231 family protein [Thalassobacillus pellis]MBM7553372.1 hypothetical protein [Thalassobacillus pellis]
MDKPNITSSEIAMLWTQYLQNTMSVQILRHFSETVEDEDVSRLVEQSLSIALNIVEEMKQLFKTEKIPVPRGFDETDVDIHAPRLSTDNFMWTFLENLGKAGMLSWSIAQSTATRSDIRTLFTSQIMETSRLFNNIIDTGLEKGFLIRPPYIEKPERVEFIEGKSYISNGFNPFHKRTLNDIEILHCFENTKTNAVGEMICTAFAQTAQSDAVRNYMKRGREISRKHLKTFQDILHNSDIHPPMSWGNCITSSTVPVYSDRLMMFLMSVLSASGQGNYSTASTASLRYDLVFQYQRLSVEIALFAKDGLDIMIENGWMEEPPQAPDRTELIKQK